MTIAARFTRFDYVVAEASKAKAFYTQLFGWTQQRYITPLPGDSATPHWLAYLQVADAHAAAGKVKQLGGAMIKEPFAHDGGKLALAKGPTDNVVALWQSPVPEDGSWPTTPGSICWAELYTTSPTSAGTFYKQLGGFTEQKLPLGTSTYHLFMRAGAPHAAACKPVAGMPTGWFAWAAVADVDATVDKARSLGATITQPPHDMPNGARMALMLDPNGVALGVIKPGN